MALCRRISYLYALALLTVYALFLPLGGYERMMEGKYRAFLLLSLGYVLAMTALGAWRAVRWREPMCLAALAYLALTALSAALSPYGTAVLLGLAVTAVLGLPLLFPRRRRAMWALTLLLTAAAFALIWFFPGDGGTLSELHRLLHGDVDLTFGSSRLLIWRSLLPLIAERPLLGGGCGTLYLRDVPPFYWQRGGETTYFAVTSAHNEYLGVLVDQGALALLAFLALLALALWRAYRHAESDRCAVAGAALLCYAVTAFFSVACCITGVYLWLLLAMLAPKEK